MNTKEFKKAVELLYEEKGIDKEIIYEALNTTENWFRIDVEVVDKYHDETINEYLYIIDMTKGKSEKKTSKFIIKFLFIFDLII